MKKFTIIAATAGALAATSSGAAGPAASAPLGPPNADQTVSQLQAQGYNVIVVKVGGEPLDQCTVSAVRPGQTYSRTDSGVPGGGGDDLVTTVTDRTVYVYVRC